MKDLHRIKASSKITSKYIFGAPACCWWIQSILIGLTAQLQPTFVVSFSSNQLIVRPLSHTGLNAKRNRKSRTGQDNLDAWYDDVDENASPDDVFWQEMERQRLLNQLPDAVQEPTGTRFSASTSTMPTNYPNGNNNDNVIMNAGSIAMGLGMMEQQQQSSSNSGEKVMDKKAAEATLQEFSAFAVKDNWLDEDLIALMVDNGKLLEDLDENAKSLDEQLKDWEDEDDSMSNAYYMEGDEAWDHFGEEESEEEEKDRKKVEYPPGMNSEFLLTEGDEEQERLEAEMAEAEFQKRIKGITIRSTRLDKALKSPKAKDYFASLQPNEIEGFDQMWVSAIDNACMDNLIGTFRNYGIQFADNFGDWQDSRIEDGIEYSIEDIASYKARKVYEATGLPCIASRTSFEIEPIPDTNPSSGGYGYGSRPNENPRVLSGYRFNDVGAHVDYMCQALKLFSEPSRVTEFRSCLCYYDGELELFEYGACEVDLYFANSMRAFIPMAQAITEMIKKLQLTFGLEYQKWLRKRIDDTTGAYGGASLKLRDRVLKEGKVLRNDIIDVSSFMDSKVDVNLMDDCAKELAKRFMDERPTKILTVATTGLVIALPMAKYLQVPVVYARKERNVVMANTFKAGYSSKTVGKNRELLVSTNHIDEGERILIVDDFLSSGASQDALLRIVAEAGAEAVGVGVLLEKVYDSGRQSLSGFDIKVESLCRVASVKNGVIQLVEEDGFEQM